MFNVLKERSMVEREAIVKCDIDVNLGGGHRKAPDLACRGRSRNSLTGRTLTEPIGIQVAGVELTSFVWYLCRDLWSIGRCWARFVRSCHDVLGGGCVGGGRTSIDESIIVSFPAIRNKSIICNYSAIFHQALLHLPSILGGTMGTLRIPCISQIDDRRTLFLQHIDPLYL